MAMSGVLLFLGNAEIINENQNLIAGLGMG